MSFPWGSTTPRPDLRQNRIAWNESWETDLSRYYGHGRIIPVYRIFQSRQTAFLRNVETKSNMALGIMQITKAICDLQHDFARRVVESLAVDNFEAEWRQLSDVRRRELILEGICRASVNGGRDMEDRRMWCPEITVNGLAEQHGAGFMALVKNLLPADVHSPMVEPTYVSHPIMDKVLQDEGTNQDISASVHSLRLDRIYFISTVAWQITLAFVSFVSHILLHAFNSEKLLCSTVSKSRLLLGNQSTASSVTYPNMQPMNLVLKWPHG
jgi:hypothetical protein